MTVTERVLKKVATKWLLWNFSASRKRFFWKPIDGSICFAKIEKFLEFPSQCCGCGICTRDLTLIIVMMINIDSKQHKKLLIIEESFHNRIALNINGTIAMQRDD
jgi:hypothetical protein